MLTQPDRHAVRTALIPLLAVMWLLLVPPAALAISAPIHVSGTDGEGVFIRPEPNTSRAPVGWMPEGASPDFNCFAWGQSIGGVPIWFNVNWGGVTGYYASFYDDSSYHSNEELTAKYGVPLCGSAPPASPPSPTPSPAPSPGPAPSAPAPSASLVFTIYNAEEGVYYRNSPSWGDTSRTPGVGVYDGDRVELICGGYGDPVGPYANKAWSKVRNLTRPSIGEGWVNEHFIDDGAPSNGFVAGEPQCGAGAAPAPAPASSSGPKSVFYSPNNTPTGVSGIPAVADLDVIESEWAEGHCSTSGATNIPAGVNTLAGWSLGRLGPILFLRGAPKRWPEVHRIVLFDPGSASNFKQSCDGTQAVSYLFAEWLTSSSSNRLEVYTGHDTEEHQFYDWGKSNFGGLWHYYFPQIWNQPFAGQVRVCDYNNADHEDIMSKLAWVVRYPPSDCPSVSGLASPVSWHP